MSEPVSNDYSHKLLQLMQRVGLSNFKALSRASGVPEKQLRRLRRGDALQLRLEIFLKLSLALQVPVTQLFATFAGVGNGSEDIQQEYDRLKIQFARQRQEVIEEFQQSSLEILESWLRQWPTVEYKAQEHPELAAVKVLPLVRPVQQLVQQWGVEAIAAVGTEVAYDPQWHQLTAGTAEVGARVKVVRAGYRHGEKLLYRAEVAANAERQ